MVSTAALSPREALLTSSSCLRFIHQREEKNWKGEKTGEEEKDKDGGEGRREGRRRIPGIQEIWSHIYMTFKQRWAGTWPA